MNTYSYFDEQPRTPSRKSRGCLFWGCIITSSLLVAIGGCTALAVYKGYKFIMSRTSIEPMLIQPYEADPEAYEKLMEKLQAFRNAEPGSPAAELRIAEDDINNYIANDPDLKQFSGKVYFHIEEDVISTEASISLDDVPGFSGRYVNGEITVNIFLENGALIVTACSIEVNGQALPEQVMKKIGKENLARATDQNEALNAFIKDLEEIEIRDGLMILRR